MVLIVLLYGIIKNVDFSSKETSGLFVLRCLSWFSLLYLMLLIQAQLLSRQFNELSHYWRFTDCTHQIVITFQVFLSTTACKKTNKNILGLIKYGVRRNYIKSTILPLSDVTPVGLGSVEMSLSKILHPKLLLMVGTMHGSHQHQSMNVCMNNCKLLSTKASVECPKLNSMPVELCELWVMQSDPC